MATILARTYVQPIITGHRLTCYGHQYNVRTPEFTDVVTVNGARIACTCQSGLCEHIQAVTHYRARQDARDAQRRAYEAAFDLSYGDGAYCWQ